MNLLRHLLIVFAISALGFGQDNPGWRIAPPERDPQDVTGWMASIRDTAGPGTLEKGPMDGSAFEVSDQEAALSLGRAERSESLPSALRTGPVGNEADTITPEIRALAAGLKNDPVKIFEFVRNYVDYQCYYGSKKGAHLTLLEGSGNDTDQAALLVALLRAGGHTASYAYGPCQFSLTAFPQWWGIAARPYSYMTNERFGEVYGITDTSEANIARWRLRLAVFETATAAGYYYVDPFVNVIEWVAIPYTYVEFTSGGVIYNLSPAYKLYASTTGINLVTATQYNRANLLSSAGGATGSPDWVTSLSEAGIHTRLSTYTNNLISTLRSGTNHERAVRSILGGRRITKASYASLSELPGMAPRTGVTWGTMQYSNAIPTTMMSKLEITAGIHNPSNDTFTTQLYTHEITMPSLQGKKLSLSFSGSAGSTASIHLDEELRGPTFNVSGAGFDLRLKAKHGHYLLAASGGSWIQTDLNHSDQRWTTEYRKGGNHVYAFPYCFGNPEKQLRNRQQQLDFWRREGTEDWRTRTEGMNILGLTYYKQVLDLEAAAGPLYQAVQMHHHLFGRAAQETAFYVDIGLLFSAPIQADMNPAHWEDYFQMTTMFGSAMEHGVIEQTQGAGTLAASTMSVIRKANADGTRIYRATSANKAAVTGELQNYSTSTKNKLSALLITSKDFMLLPRSGMVTINEWTGGSYAFENDSSTLMVIGKNFNGGYSAYNNLAYSIAIAAAGYGTDPAVLLGMSSYFPEASYSPVTAPTQYSWDPIEMASGAYALDKTDLSLGDGSSPLGLAFSRNYHSNRRYDNGAGLGYGWTHNYNIFITERSAPEALLGGANGYQMAPIIAALVAAKDLHTNHANAKEWATAALVVNWAIEQMNYTAVSVTMGSRSLQFIKMPDGTYIPPPGMNLTLTKDVAGNYVITERNGNVMSFNPDKKLAVITNPKGAAQTFTYDGSKQLISVQDAFNRTLTYHWSGSTISSISDGTGRSISFTYGAGDLTGFTDAESKVWTYQYDAEHRMKSLKDPQTRTIAENDYDADSRVTKQRSMGDPGKEWTYLYTGYVNTEINPLGGETLYYHDERGRSFGIENDKAEFSVWSYDGQDRKIVSVGPEGERFDWYFDANNNVEVTEDERGFSSLFFYDNALRLEEKVDNRFKSTTYTYTPQHQPETVTDPLGHTTSYTYQSQGLPATVTDAGNKTTTFGYDSTGGVNRITRPDGTFQTLTNNSRGDLLAITDAEGRTTTNTWNKRRQLLTVTLPPVIGEPDAAVTNTYDDSGNLAGTTDAKGNTTTHTYNALAKSVATTLPPLAAGNNVIAATYDLRDWLTELANSLGHTTSTEYDSVGRAAITFDPLARPTASVYDRSGRITEIRDPLDRVTKFVWNSRGENTRTTNPLIHHVDGAFDGNGNQTLLKNRRGKDFTTTFDDANRPTSSTTPSGKVTSTAYFDNNLTETVTEPSGQSTTMAYNGKNLLSSKADPSGTITYGYDDSGLLEIVTEGAAVLTRTYDTRGRLSSFTTADGDQIGYRYDANGNLTRITYPGGKEVHYTYNARNLLATVTDWSSRTTSYTYDRLGRLTGISRPNGTSASLTYDATGKLTSQRESSGGKLISYLRLDHDAAGRIERRFRAPLGQSAWQHPQFTATYDDDNRLAMVNGQAVTVDPDGNLMSGPISPESGSIGLGYNSRNQLISAGGLSYTYDAEGRRRTITDAGGTTRDVIDPNSAMSRLLIRHHPDGRKTHYVYGLGLLYEIDDAENTKTYHFDQVGSTIVRTGDGGNVIGSAEYSAYGLLIRKDGDMETAFLYNGQAGVQTDANGLLQMRARYYSPYLMRFLNADPIGFSGGLNWFAYADGNPISQVDPFGLSAIDHDLSRNAILLGFGQPTGNGTWIKANGTEVDSHDRPVFGGHNASLFASGLGAKVTSGEVWKRNLAESAKNPANWMAGFGMAGGLNGLRSAATGAEAITLNSGGAGSVLEASILRNINQGEKIADLMAEAKGITFMTGNEVAAVSLTNGQRVLVQGGSAGISNLESLGVRRVLGHTHPYGGTGPIVPSSGDIRALQQLGQKHSYIIERGQVTRFNSP